MSFNLPTSLLVRDVIVYPNRRLVKIANAEHVSVGVSIIHKNAAYESLVKKD